MSKLFYPAIFRPEETGYSIFVPDIEGCFSQGDTLEEAYDMAFDAIGLSLEEYAANEIAPPVPSKPEDITHEQNDCIVLIQYDPIVYQKRHDKRAVKKTLTIPSWLNSIAEEQHVNFSKLLQSALIEHLDISTP